jgi:hypothetical protein
MNDEDSEGSSHFRVTIPIISDDMEEINKKTSTRIVDRPAEIREGNFTNISLKGYRYIDLLLVYGKGIDY